MSLKTQALLIIRAAFDFLVKVRYLGGNPWIAVKNPKPVRPVYRIQIEKALSKDTWTAVVTGLQQRCAEPQDRHYRQIHQNHATLAVLWLLGDAGFADGAWVLRVTDKGSKERDVAISPRTMQALRQRWIDRELDWAVASNHCLVAPLTIPPTASAQARATQAVGYRGDALYSLLTKAMQRVARHIEGKTRPAPRHTPCNRFTKDQFTTTPTCLNAIHFASATKREYRSFNKIRYDDH